jgi:hypothetical protein
MDVKSLIGETKAVEYEFGGERGSVSYRPGVFTLAFDHELLDSVGKNDIPRFAAALSNLIAGWDLANDGQPIPVTAEGIMSVPQLVLDAILGTIRADTRPSESEGKALSGPTSTPPSSSTPQPSVNFPNGSDLPAPPASGVSLPGSSPVSQSGGQT